MQTFPKTLIWRHRKENLRKCSLKGLESRSDIDFFSYPQQTLPDVSSYLMLTVDPEAEVLSPSDCNQGLLLIDGTWRYAEQMVRSLGNFPLVRKRILPSHFLTAYPRRQEGVGCVDPSRGLASVEALYLAYMVMGRCPDGLLDHYYWRASFLEKNKQFLF